MPGTSKPQKNRGTALPMPVWWLKSVQRETAGLAVELIAEVLQRAAPRTPPWGREAVGKFLKGSHTTMEMADAFVRAYDRILPPFFFARSHEEAHAFLLQARRFDEPSNPEKAARITALNKVREHLEESIKDQSDRLDSKDEGISRGRRPRGVGRGRATS